MEFWSCVLRLLGFRSRSLCSCRWMTWWSSHAHSWTKWTQRPTSSTGSHWNDGQFQESHMQCLHQCTDWVQILQEILASPLCSIKHLKKFLVPVEFRKAHELTCKLWFSNVTLISVEELDEFKKGIVRVSVDKDFSRVCLLQASTVETSKIWTTWN